MLLSHLPLLPLLEQAARLVGPAVLSYGPAALRGAVEEAQRWPPLEWGCRVELPLLGVEAVRAELPLLTALPGSALPAAVGATLGLHLPPGQPGQQQQQQEAEYGAAGGRGGAAGSSSSSLATGAAPVGGEAAANGSLPPASFAACSEGVGGAKSDGGADGAAAAALGPAAASPAQVAAALAAELDGCDGVPLCLLPQAYGRQELAASPFGAADCFTPLRGSLPQLWALWELLLVGEPLMVVAPSPGGCQLARGSARAPSASARRRCRSAAQVGGHASGAHVAHTAPPLPCPLLAQAPAPAAWLLCCPCWRPSPTRSTSAPS